MEMKFDLGTGADGQADGLIPCAPGHPEWPVLRARLMAARESFCALNQGTGAESARNRGSFDHVAAHRLATYGQNPDVVNPNASVNCKPIRGNDALVAGATTTGERG